MKVSVSKSKNQTIYYLSKSVWVDGKSTTKTIEKIGSEDELLKVCGDLTPLEWAKQYAAKRSAEEKASKKDIMLKYSSSTLIKKESCRSVNVGYLFLKDISRITVLMKTVWSNISLSPSTFNIGTI